MKTLVLKDILEEVRKKLDEVNANEFEEGYSDEEGSNTDSLIKSCIPEAYRLTILAAPQSMVEGHPYDGHELSINDDLVGTVSLPEDFLRLVNVRLSSWISSCSDVITEDEPTYRMQSNKWVCGSPKNPVVAVVDTESGKKLELYKAASKEDKVRVFSYLPVVNADGNIDIPNQLEGSFIYYTAGLVLASYREDNAEDCFKIARSLMGLEQ